MKIDILTLFPEMFSGPFDESIIRRAQDKGLLEIKIHNLREWADDKHRTVDDRPYGGGVGMVLMIEPIYRALQELKIENLHPEGVSQSEQLKIVLLDPTGTPFNQLKAQQLSKLKHLILITGHYEGVDERVKEHLIDEEISIGDYILTGGELPAMVIVDAVARLIPGVLEKPEAIENESFQPITSNIKHLTSNIQLLEHPQYTRPENFRGWKVAEILLSGNHQEIAKWKKEQSLKKTRQRRPDLLKRKI